VKPSSLTLMDNVLRVFSETSRCATSVNLPRGRNNEAVSVVPETNGLSNTPVHISMIRSGRLTVVGFHSRRVNHQNSP
jgi:hypothetical protein